MSDKTGSRRLITTGTCREILDLSIGDRLICKFDTGGYQSITHTFRNQILDKLEIFLD